MLQELSSDFNKKSFYRFTPRVLFTFALISEARNKQNKFILITQLYCKSIQQSHTQKCSSYYHCWKYRFVLRSAIGILKLTPQSIFVKIFSQHQRAVNYFHDSTRISRNVNIAKYFLWPQSQNNPPKVEMSQKFWRYLSIAIKWKLEWPNIIEDASCWRKKLPTGSQVEATSTLPLDNQLTLAEHRFII